MNPNQLALANKAALEATGAFVVESDGRVRMSPDRGGGYAPPWVWAGAIPAASGNDSASQALRIKLSTPASDPSSPWHSMYQSGGPFSHASQWDSGQGTYEGGTDWGTLLGTLGVGTLFAEPVLASLFGGGGGAGAAGGIAIPGAEFDPAMVYGGASGPLAGIPPAFGQSATDTLTSAAGSNPAVRALTSLNTSSPLVKALAGVGGLIGGKVLADQATRAAVPQSLTDMLDLMNKRAQAQNPMFNAVNSGFYQMLPDYAKTGGPPTAV